MSTNFGISTESPVIAGQKLKGTIWGQVTKEISAREFIVELKGVEKSHVSWQESSGSGDNRHEVTRHGDAQRPIIQASISVMGSSVIQNGKIYPGMYQIPFSFDLPDTLPSSLRVQSGHGSRTGGMPTDFNSIKQTMQQAPSMARGRNNDDSYGNCEIEYEIKVRVLGSGVFSNYHCEAPVIIQAKPMDPDSPKVPFEGPPDTKTITTCCCIGEGTVMFGCLVDNTMVAANKSIVVSMGCTNNSKKAITSVDATLSQTVSWSANGHTCTNTQILATRNFGTWDDLRPKEDLKSRDLPEFQESKQIYEEMKAGDHSVELAIPVNPIASYSGKLIEVTHELDVVVQTDGCCTSNPTISIPILVRESVSTMTSSATPIPAAYANAVVASIVNMAQAQMQLGGMPVQIQEGQTEEEIVFPGLEHGEISLKTLLADMDVTTSDKDLVEDRLKDPGWLEIFKSLKENDFAQVLSKVDMEFYQASVASMIAEKIPNFTCSYVTAAMTVVKDWNRGQLVEKLLPFCTDLQQNHLQIKNKLSAWDQTVTEQAFQNALNSK